MPFIPWILRCSWFCNRLLTDKILLTSFNIGTYYSYHYYHSSPILLLHFLVIISDDLPEEVRSSTARCRAVRMLQAALHNASPSKSISVAVWLEGKLYKLLCAVAIEVSNQAISAVNSSSNTNGNSNSNSNSNSSSNGTVNGTGSKVESSGTKGMTVIVPGSVTVSGSGLVVYLKFMDSVSPQLVLTYSF